jgi:hypothetical protein
MPSSRLVLSSSSRFNKENKQLKPLRTTAAAATQSEPHLIELTAVNKAHDANNQTDFFLERPRTPLFIPAKVGKDMSTQIEKGDLFDFDREVQPLLEVLLGRTLELAMLEVLEEEELASLRRRQAKFEALRNTELIEAQRMEAAERRRSEERDRRKFQEEARARREQQVVQKLLAVKYAKLYLANVERDAIQELDKSGKFLDPKEADIEINFLPKLVALAQADVAARCAADALAIHLLAF